MEQSTARGFAILVLYPKRDVYPSDPAILFKVYNQAFDYAFDRLGTPYRYAPKLRIVPWWKKHWKIVEVHALLE